MITDETYNSLQFANIELLRAENELCRPHEDVVTLSACEAVRNSMKRIMQLYLTTRSLQSGSDDSLENLLNQCISTNEIFQSVDISNITCKSAGHKECAGRYCLSVDRVNNCVNAANQLKTLVWKELKI